jgi:hypothetical protein
MKAIILAGGRIAIIRGNDIATETYSRNWWQAYPLAYEELTLRGIRQGQHKFRCHHVYSNGGVR